ncbi:hypothetical protein NKH18_47665 [Streptomyces sp. M10(2022)]
MTLIPHSRTADQPEVRFKPTRAGVIGLWDYTDEEFVFADGRLVLRGHNGSGKTKALEVLFPSCWTVSLTRGVLIRSAARSGP